IADLLMPVAFPTSEKDLQAADNGASGEVSPDSRTDRRGVAGNPGRGAPAPRRPTDKAIGCDGPPEVRAGDPRPESFFPFDAVPSDYSSIAPRQSQNKALRAPAPVLLKL